MIFATMPAFGGDERETLLLAHSLRQFAHRFGRAPIWVLVPTQAPLSTQARTRLKALNVSLVPFEIPASALHFPYAQKVYAAAAAEARAARTPFAKTEILVWLDSDALLLTQPDEFELPANQVLGCCPVQLKNISSPASEPIDAFWQAVYTGCGVSPEQVFPLLPTLEKAPIRAHFNAGLLAVRPQAGLLRAWQANFERLFGDPVFAPFYTHNPLYRIFVHQAILAGTVLARLHPTQIRFFSARYNLALFLLARFPVQVAAPVLCRYDAFTFFEGEAWRTHACLAQPAVAHLIETVSGAV